MLTFVSKLVHYGYSSIAWIGASCKNYGRGYGRYSSRCTLQFDKEVEHNAWSVDTSVQLRHRRAWRQFASEARG